MSLTTRKYVYTAVILAAEFAANYAFAAPPKKKAPAKKVEPAHAIVPARVIDLRVVDRQENFHGDYEAEVYSGVPLTDPYAEERGLSHGLVWMAFSNTRQLTFRVPKEKLKRIVRLVVDDDPKTPPGFALAKKSGLISVAFTSNAADTSNHSFPKDRLDVIDTTDGTVVVMTSTGNAGIFTASDVYTFPKGTPDDDMTAVTRAPIAHRERLRDALTVARAKTTTP